MRPAVAVFAVAAIVVLGLVILIGGRGVEPVEHEQVFTKAEEAAPAPKPQKLRAAPKLAEQSESDAPAPDDSAASEKTAVESAKAPPPEPGDEGTILYQPVAQAAGLVEAMGYTVSVAGTEIVDPGESCSFAGRDWACGMAARTAFRSWLRGRALSCVVPTEPGPEAVVTDCKLGNQDAGAWLVANGWARAAAGGPYAEAGEKARSAKKGIFGPPPSTAGLPEPGTTTSALPAPAPDAPAFAPDAGEVFPPPPEAPSAPLGAPATPFEAPVTPPVFPPAPVQ